VGAGVLVGCGVGALVGAGVGVAVGTTVGTSVGVTVGFGEGVAIGASVNVKVGDNISVGDIVLTSINVVCRFVSGTSEPPAISVIPQKMIKKDIRDEALEMAASLMSFFSNLFNILLN
jgi:hypothetical protein